MTDPRAHRAASAVRDALAGELGEGGVALAQLFTESAREGRRASSRADQLEAEANALAAVLADVLDGKPVDDVADDLPAAARLRVIAYRHASGPLAVLQGWTQFGRLPKVPPRASVMRERVRTIDVDPVVDPTSSSV